MTFLFNDHAAQSLDELLVATVTIDHKNNVVLFNKAAESLWGLRREEVIGQNVKQLVPADIRPNHDDFVNKNRETGENVIVGSFREVQLVKANGQQIWVKLSVAKLNVGNKIYYTASLQDITTEHESRETFKATLEQANDAVVCINEKNIITLFNQKAEQLWGRGREEVVGENVKLLVPADIQAVHDDFVNANRTTGVDKIVGTSRQVAIERTDGKRLWASLSLSKIDLDNRILSKTLS